MAQEREIAIHAMWRGDFELTCHIYAWNLKFAGTGHHYTGPFRNVVAFFENGQACSQALWRWVERRDIIERRDIAYEGEMIIAGMLVLYP